MSTVPSPEHPDERPDEESSIPDEQWEAFLRDASEGGGAPAPEEPSARARMVTRRLREEADAQQRGSSTRRRWRVRLGRRKKARAAEPWAPSGWRTGPVWQEINGRAHRRRQVWSALGVLLAVAVAVVAVRPSLLLDRLPGYDSTAAASPSPLPAETVLPTGAPADVEQAGTPTREHPFRGSPAERWADGADAIELPPAKAVGGMSKDDVALALRRTKEFLVDANLDAAVLRGGQPTRALSLLEPKQPALLSQLERSLREPSRNDNPLGLFSRFDPDEARVAGEVVKVRGHMTFEAGETGEVRVHADYTFVYPLVRADGDGDRVARTIVRRDVTMTLADPAEWIVTKGKLTLESYASEFFNSECDIDDGYFHPVFPGDAPTGAPATGPSKDPYDRRQSLMDEEAQHEECGTVTRT
ncbi:hypothetical protein ACIF9R_06570 [Streptomyces sp. NPDC086080]|uniref:hypothetical protein n=1 Tax=Streptomyces sp. NPDC086080 TaxID=3365748 RepID=UPI0037D0EBDB